MARWCWTRWARRRARLPRFAVWISTIVLALSGLLVLGGFLGGVRVLASPGGDQPSDRARLLAEAISACVNLSFPALLLNVAGFAFVGLSLWWAKRNGASQGSR